MTWEQLTAREVQVEEFLLLFDDRDYEDSLIAALNHDIRDQRVQQAMLLKKRELMRQIAKRGSSSHNKKKDLHQQSTNTLNNTNYSIQQSE
jgi:hypothetical protein